MVASFLPERIHPEVERAALRVLDTDSFDPRSLKSARLAFAERALFRNRAFMLKVVREQGENLRYASDSLRADRDVLLAALGRRWNTYGASRRQTGTCCSRPWGDTRLGVASKRSAKLEERSHTCTCSVHTHTRAQCTRAHSAHNAQRQDAWRQDICAREHARSELEHVT